MLSYANEREFDLMITLSEAIRCYMHQNSLSPAVQENKMYLVLPALRFELELFSSRTGRSRL